MAIESLYLRADEIKVGDTLPDVSEFAVEDVSTSIPGLVIIDFGPWARHVHRGPDGFPSFRVIRPAVESEEDYARACDAMHAANTFRLEGDL